ncbi:MAG: DUF3352 domain-containing protein [Planctomycetota bacterium]
MRRFLLIATFAVLAAGPMAAAQEAPAAPATPRLELLVPDHTFFYASFHDVAGMRAQCGRTAMGKLANEPEVVAFLAPAIAAFEEHMKTAEQEAGHPIRSILDSIAGQAAVAVISWDPLYGGMIPDAAALIDLGVGRADFEKIHAEAIVKAGDRIRVEAVEHAGVPFQTLTLKGGVKLSIAYLGNSLVMATMAETMRGVIDAAQGKLEKPLAGSANFGAVRARTGKDAFFSAYVNVESILAHFGDRVPPIATHAMQKLAVDSIKALGFGSSFAGEGVRETFFAYVPGEKKGLMKVVYADPGSGMELLPLVPRNAFYATVGRFDLEKTYAETLQLVGDFDPNVLEQVMQGIHQAEEFVGLKIREDLLAPLGNQMGCYAAMPSGGGLIPDIVTMVTLDAPEKFEQSLVQLVDRGKEQLAGDERLTMELRSLTTAGKKIFYIHVSEEWGDPVAVTPSYVREGNVTYFSLYPQVLKDLAVRGFKGPSIAENPDFSRALAALPADMTSIEYLDFNAVMRVLYGSVVPVLQLAAKRADIPVDMALLPRTETVTKHFYGGIWGVKLEEDGIAMYASSPVGILPTVFVSAAPLLLLSRAESREVFAEEETEEAQAK